MAALEEKLVSLENIDGGNNSNENDEEEGEECEDSVGGKNDKFHRIDGKFRKIVDSLSAKIWHAHQSNDPDDLTRLVQYLQLNRKSWEDATDHHGRSILHHAVEEENSTLVQTLLNVGINPNVKERCGVTPLTLAIIKGNQEIVKFLFESFAEFDDKFYTSVPAPKVMADKMNLPTIRQLLDDFSTKEADSDKIIWELVERVTVANTGSEGSSSDVLTEEDGMPSSTFVYDRSRPNVKTKEQIR